ncbi:MAG TPA: GMC family oxidoreductase [Acidimicrobiales bacterium]|nr:GMC family oxidoreductase [Acidimicrobiales bacterium]
MTEPPVDVLVIGAGVAGAVVAKRLVEAGLSVTCLEQGNWPDRAEYPGASPEWELRAARQWSSSPHVRNAIADYPIEASRSDLGVLNFNGVGGGSVLYNAQWPRMLPADFRAGTLDGVAEDWPIGYAELQPYYEATDRDFGVSGLGGNPMYPPGADPPLPPLPIGDIGLRVARAHARLGWHWWPGTNAILSARHAGRNPCVQRGSCGSGCNEGAKASTDVTHWPAVVRMGGRVITGARVRRIVLDARGLACGAEWADDDGREHYQAADVVVCAANGIGTPRLLLASASRHHPDGLANSSGLVGRNLMLHPLASVTGLFDGPADGWRAHNGVLVHSLEFARTDPARGFVRGATWALVTAGGPLRAALAPDGRGSWGAAHHANVRQRLGRSGSWVIIAEDLPDPANRVELSTELADAAGLAAPSVTYRLADNTRRLMAWHVDRARESLAAAGAWRTEVTWHRANGHFMGTARMGNDPSTSVVGPDCLAHDIANLMVPDGSAFVTAGSANPTTTIAAVARHAAECLLARHGDIPRPVHRRAFGSTAVAGQAPGARRAAVHPPAPQLTPDERDRLRAIADELIPADDVMPPASAAGVGDERLDQVLHARPDLWPPLKEALSADAPLTERQLATVRYVVAGAYYLAPAVREALGYRPGDALPVRPDALPDYIEEGLLDHLLAAEP